MATQPIPQQGQQQGQPQGDPLEKFRQLAQQVQQLAQDYPEFTESGATILREIQKGMVKVAGSPQRQQEPKAPPMV